MLATAGDGAAAAQQPSTVSVDQQQPAVTIMGDWASVLAAVLQDGLLGLLPTEEASRLGLACRRLHDAYLSPQALRASVLAAGPSDAARFRFWGHALRVRAVQRELVLAQQGQVVSSDSLEEVARGIFRTALFGPQQGEGQRGAQAPVCSGKRMLSTDGQEGEILRDISRTFPLEPLFRDSGGVGQNLLASVLKACLAFHADVGYMQGMNYVAAGLLFALRRQLLPPSPFTHAPRAGRRQHKHEAFPTEYYGTMHCTGGLSTSVSSTSSSYLKLSASAAPPHGSGALAPPRPHHNPSPSPTPTTTTDEEAEDGYRSDHSGQSLGDGSSSTGSSGHFHTTATATSSSQWEGSPAQMTAACDAFWLMTAALSSTSGLAMRLLWHPEVPHLKLRTFQFEKLLALHLPRLHAHFRQIRLAPDILTTQWCNTLLAYCLPLPVLLRVWDVVFLDGWKALFRVCLALLQAVEADLLPLNLEDSGRFLRQWTARRHPLWREPNRLLRAARGFKVTRGALHELTEEFHLTLLREQLNGGGSTGEWLARYGPGAEREMLKEPELEGLRAAIQGIEGPARSDFGHLRAKIEEAAQRREAAKRRADELDGKLGDVAAQVEELEAARAAMLLQQQQQKQHIPEATEAQDATIAPTPKPPSPRPQPLLPPAPVAHGSGVTGAGGGLPMVPSLASTLMASIREIRPALPSIKTRVLHQLGVNAPPTPSTVVIPSPPLPTPHTHDTAAIRTPRARAGTDDSVTSSLSSSSVSSSTRSRRSSLDLAAMGSALSRLAERLAPPPVPSGDDDAAAVVEGNSSCGGDGGTVVLTPNSNGSGGNGGRGTAALAAITGQSTVAGQTGRSTDALVQERRLTKLDVQLASLRAQCAGLQLQRSEAAVALEEAEAFRLSLSAQLLHLLQEAEDRVQQRLREAARTHLLPPGQHHHHRATEQPIGTAGVDV